jgi:hypothetical protein
MSDTASRIDEHERLIVMANLDETYEVKHLVGWFALRKRTAKEYLKQNNEETKKYLMEILLKCDYNIKKVLGLA